MTDYTHLIEAMAHDTGTMTAAAASESRKRLSRRQTRRQLLASASVIALLIVSLWSLWQKSDPPRLPSMKTFSTAGVSTPVPEFSTSAVTAEIHLFASQQVRLAIKDIDDPQLLATLGPYRPVIVYAGANNRPTLLLLNEEL